MIDSMKELKALLIQKRSSILKRWFDLILEAYPPETADFFRGEKDRFANPAGYIISHGLETLFDELTRETDSGAMIAALDSIIRIRAVQGINSFQALTFVFLIKKAIREELEREIEKRGFFNDYLSFESRIDDMSLSAFDVYTKCREEIHQIRVREIKTERDMVSRTLEMMNRKKGA